MKRRDKPGATEARSEAEFEPAAKGVGAMLQEARLRRGWSIADVARQLRIRAPILEAIESGKFETLPNKAYVLGFARSYADFLGLDKEEIVRRVKAEAAALIAEPELVLPQPLSESRLPSGAILLVSLCLAGGAYGLWYYYTAADRVPIPRVAAVPEEVVAPVERSTPNSSSAQAEAATVLPRSAPASSESEPAPAATRAPEAAPARAPEVVTPPAAPQVASVPPPAAAPAEAPPPRAIREEGSGRVVIHATGDSWVQVRDASGTILFSRIMKAGDSYSPSDRSGLLLSTGSAGMLDIMVDGKKVPPIGRPGFIRRDVPVDPEKLLAGTAVVDTGPTAASAPAAAPVRSAPAAVAPPPASVPTTPAPVSPRTDD